MKNQALFSSKDKSKKMKCRLLQFLFGDLRVRQGRNYVYLFSWLVGFFGFNGSLRQYFSLYQAVSQREGERREKG